MTTKRNRARCRDCGTVIESTHRHHWVSCPCGNFVDGGQDYFRWGEQREGALERLDDREDTMPATPTPEARDA